MMLVIEGLRAPAEVKVLGAAAEGLAFGGGKATAGKFAHAVKANDQAPPSPERGAVRCWRGWSAPWARTICFARRQDRALSPR